MLNYKFMKCIVIQQNVSHMSSGLVFNHHAHKVFVVDVNDAILIGIAHAECIGEEAKHHTALDEAVQFHTSTCNCVKSARN